MIRVKMQRNASVLLAALIAGLFSPASSWSADPGCVDGFTDLPPFYVAGDSYIPSSRHGRRVDSIVHENFSGRARSLTTAGDVASMSTGALFPATKIGTASAKFISRGSVVRVPGDATIAENYRARIERNEDFFMPVEVMASNDTYKAYKPARERSRFVVPGDRGVIWTHGLKAGDNSFTYVLTRDANLLEGGENRTFKAGEALKPVMSRQNGTWSFKVEHCGPDSAPRTLYYFNAYDVSGNAVTSGSVGLDPGATGCLVPPIRAVSNDLYQEVLDVAHNTHEMPDFNDFGRVKLPLEPPVTEGYIEGVPQVIEYAPDRTYYHFQGNIEADGSSDWGRAGTMCSVLSTLAAWKKKCMAGCRGAADHCDSVCTTGIGDIGFITPARGSIDDGRLKARQDVLTHVGHSTGECVDVRPIRKDGQHQRVDWRMSEFDRAETAKFIQFLIDHGADGPIFFNDPKIRRQFGGKVHFHADHDNHIHFCMRRPDVATACRNENLDHFEFRDYSTEANR